MGDAAGREGAAVVARLVEPDDVRHSQLVEDVGVVGGAEAAMAAVVGEAHVDQLRDVPVQIAGVFVGPDQLDRFRSGQDAANDLVDLTSSDARPMATLAPRLASWLIARLLDSGRCAACPTSDWDIIVRLACLCRTLRCQKTKQMSAKWYRANKSKTSGAEDRGMEPPVSTEFSGDVNGMTRGSSAGTQSGHPNWENGKSI